MNVKDYLKTNRQKQHDHLQHGFIMNLLSDFIAWIYFSFIFQIFCKGLLEKNLPLIDLK